MELWGWEAQGAGRGQRGRGGAGAAEAPGGKSHVAKRIPLSHPSVMSCPVASPLPIPPHSDREVTFKQFSSSLRNSACCVARDKPPPE